MASTSRPQPMNASTNHPKVKVSCVLSDPLYVAGGLVAGKMEVECRTDKGLGLSVIMVELFAIEELTSRDHSATSTFYHTRRLFQGPGLPPSNSVHAHPPAGAPPLPPDYYNARKGMTTFLFRFPLPPSCPSSINFGSGLATIKYEVRATVGVAYKGENRLVFDKKEVDIVEAFEPDFAQVDPEAVVIGESGKIWLQARLLGGVVVANRPACIELTVKNHSLKKNTSLNLSLSRHLHFPNVPPSQKAPFQISDTLITVPFKGPDYIIHPGSEGVANLVFDAPKNSRGVKGGQRPGNEDSTKQLAPLFEVKCIVTVTMSMGLGSKDLAVEIPVPILHHKALPALPQELEPPQPLVQPHPVYEQPYMPVTPIPVMYTGRPISPYDYIPPQPPMSPHPGLPYVDHGNMWLPYGAVPHQLPYYPQLQPMQQYYYPPPQSNLIPLHTGNGSFPIRASSTEPAPSQPLHSFHEVPPHAQQPQQPLHFPVTAEPEQHYAVGNAETEEGKGERAERVSRQLRMSMRARSSSPSHHRFPVHPPPAQVQPFFGSPPQDQPISPTSPPFTRKPSVHLTLQNLPPPLVQQHTGGSGELHSPRPVLSPKASFTVDPFTNEIKGMTKDERVENLEKMAEEAVRENSDMSGSGGLNAGAATGASPKNQPPEINKTLPLPPPPVEESPGFDSLFPPAPLVPEEEEITPKTPTLTAVTPFKLGRSMYRHLNAPDPGRGAGATSGLSGLDALEARLIAEVGTRKIDNDDAKPDVRSVLAMPIDIPNPRGRTADRGEGHARSPGEKNASVCTQAISEDVNDSAISSLTLAGEGKSPVANALRYEEAGGPKTLRMGRSMSRGQLNPLTEDTLEKIQTPRDRERERRPSAGKKSTTSGPKDGGKSEGRKMRKAAVGRVADWLGKIDPDVPPPQVDTPPPTSPLSGTGSLGPQDSMFSPVFTPSHPGSPEVSSKLPLPEVEPSKTPVSKRTPELEGKGGAEWEVSANPNPRSSGFMPIRSVGMKGSPSPGKEDAASTPKPPSIQLPWMQKFEAADSTPADLNSVPRFGRNAIPPDLADKYDIRSARGGRGGRVTAVAAIWAAGEKQNGSADRPMPKPWVKPYAPGKPIITPKPTKPTVALKPTGLSATKPPSTKPTVTNPVLRKIDVGKVRPAQGVSNPHAGQEDEDESPTKGTNHARARMIKSSSVPAVISSSTAIPMISSTASLVRPPGSSPVRERPGKISRGLNARIPTIEEDIASDSTSVGTGHTRGGEGKPHVVGSPTKTDLAFGQARLRDLIKKYQG